MKIIIAVIGLAFFVQTIYVFEALGQQTEPSPVNCSEHDSTTCCNETGCKLYVCLKNGTYSEDEEKCGNETDRMCPNNTRLLEDFCTASANTSNTTLPQTSSTATTNVTSTTTTQTSSAATSESTTTRPTTSASETNATTGAVTPTKGTATTATTGTVTPTNGTATPATETATPTTGSTSGAPGSPTTGGDSGRHFDAASFIGGIVLCLGLGVIAFIGLKYYRSRTQQNYRTL